MTAPDFTIADDVSGLVAQLKKARALVKRGWTQARFERVENGRTFYCATGALSKVALDGQIVPLCVALENAVGVDSTPAVWEWNDAPERTQAEVVAAFDRAIELAVSQ